MACHNHIQEFTDSEQQAFMTVLKQEPNQTFQSLLKSVRRVLRDKYDQKPQLSSSHKIVSLLFIGLSGPEADMSCQDISLKFVL
jgi:hypothetical protein